MDRNTLIIVLIVVLIVLKMIGGSLQEHFSTRACDKKYSSPPKNGECPENCKNSIFSPEYNPHLGPQKKWKCVQ